MKKVIVGAAMVLLLGGVSQHNGVNAQDITPSSAAQKPINLNLQDIDIRDSLKLLFSGRSDVVLMVDPDVRGTVTRTIKSPTLDNALTQLLTGTGYNYIVQAGVYHIGARVITTVGDSGSSSPDGMITARSQAQFTGPPFPPTEGTASPGMTGGNGFGNPGGGGFGAPGGGGFGTTTGGGFGGPGGAGFGGTTGGMPGGFGSGLGAPGGGGTASDTTAGGTAADATTVKITLQKPIRVNHVAPEYIIALLRWLANSSQTQTGNGYGNQQQVNGFGGGQFGNNQFGGQNGQYGNNQFGGGQFGGQSSSLNLPPTESDILGQELAQGSSSQQQYGLSATGGSGYGGQNGQYGNNQYGNQNGQFGNNQFGNQNGQFGNNQFGNQNGQFGNNQFGGGQFGNSQFGGSQFGNSQFGNNQFGGGYRGY